MFAWFKRRKAVKQQRAALEAWARAEGYGYWASKKSGTCSVDGLSGGMRLDLTFRERYEPELKRYLHSVDLRVVVEEVPWYFRTLQDRESFWYEPPADLGEPSFDRSFRAEAGDPTLDMRGFCLALLPTLEAWLERSNDLRIEIDGPDEEGRNGRALLMDGWSGMPEDPQEPIRRALALLETGRSLEKTMIRLGA